MVTIVRLENTDKATRGVLLIDGKLICCTLENPWRNNEKNVSCIPPGFYHIQRIESSRFGETFWVKDVPDREQIIFHVGNTEPDTRGCILLGTGLGTMAGEPAVLESRVAMARFMRVLSEVLATTLHIWEVNV